MIKTANDRPMVAYCSNMSLSGSYAKAYRRKDSFTEKLIHQGEHQKMEVVRGLACGDVNPASAGHGLVQSGGNT